MKRCSKCTEVKTLDLFYSNKSTKDGKACWCKICSNKQYREYMRKNSKLRAHKTREYHVKSRYGLTQIEHDKLLEIQNNRCAICEQGIKLVVDHCHNGGHVRGLLCDQCNKGLGNFKDNVNYLERAIRYLNAS